MITIGGERGGIEEFLKREPKRKKEKEWKRESIKRPKRSKGTNKKRDYEGQSIKSKEEVRRLK